MLLRVGKYTVHVQYYMICSLYMCMHALHHMIWISRYLSDRSDSHVANSLWEKAQFATGFRWSERSPADSNCKVLLLQ